MLPVCLSALFGTHVVPWFLHVSTPKFVLNEAPVFGQHGVHFKMVLIHVVRRLQHFECQGVDDSCRNFTYIPAKLQPRHDTLIIYTTFLTLCVIGDSGCGGCAFSLTKQRCWFKAHISHFFLMSNFFVNEKDS